MPTPDTAWAQLVESRLAKLESGLAENTRMTAASAETTSEIRDILSTGRALFRFADRFGAAVTWLARVGAASAAVWAAVYAATHNGKPPV